MDIIFTLFPLIILLSPSVIMAIIAIILLKKKKDNAYPVNNGYYRLCRSQSNRVFAGVCGGVAEYFGWSVTVVRLFFIFSSIGILTYIVLAIAIPDADSRLL